MIINFATGAEDVLNYRVGVLSVSFLASNADDKENFFYNLKTIAQSCTLRTCRILCLSELSSVRYMFIADGDSSDVVNCAYSIVRQLNSLYQADFSISMSTVKNGIENVTDAMCEALKATTREFTEEGVSAYLHSERKERPSPDSFNYLESVTRYVELLTDAVLNYDGSNAILSVGRVLFDELAENGVDADTARSLCRDIATCSASKFFSIFQENKIITDFLNLQFLPQEAYENITLTKMRDSFIDSYIRMQKVLKTYSSAAAPVATTIIETLDYLLETQCAKVTLQYMADYMNISSSYLSSTFKKKAGQTFREYVRQYKMEQSKSLLSRSQFTISQIATNLGYNDVVNFSRIFKKSYGISPSEYRASSIPSLTKTANA